MWGDWLRGRASRLHRGGRRFKSVIAHQLFFWVLVALFFVACGREGHLERPGVGRSLDDDGANK